MPVNEPNVEQKQHYMLGFRLPPLPDIPVPEHQQGDVILCNMNDAKETKNKEGKEANQAKKRAE